MGAGNGVGMGMNNFHQMNMGNFVNNPNQIYMNWIMNLYLKMNQQLMWRNMQNNLNNFGAQGGNQNAVLTSTIPKNMKGFCDPFPNNGFQKLNIVFATSNNTKIIMHAPVNAQMKEVFKAFVKKVGLPEYTLGRYINFLYNGLFVKCNEERTVYEIGIKFDFSTIVVLDTKNLIAGINLY